MFSSDSDLVSPLPLTGRKTAGTPGASDFRLAMQIHQAVLQLGAGSGFESLAALFREATGSEFACVRLVDDPTAPPSPWKELIAEAGAHRALATRHSPENSVSSMVLPLLAQDRIIGFVGVSGKPGGYDEESTRRFRDMGDLLSGMLAARFVEQARLAELLQSEMEVRRQTDLLDQIHDSVITMDLDGYITGWNRGAERLFGYAAEEILGKHILVIYADEGEDDPPFNVFLENGSHQITVRRRKKSGEIFWASVSLSVAEDETSQPRGLIGYVVDISGQMEAEEKLQLHARIFERNSEAVLVTNASGEIVSVNQAFAGITGYPEAEVLGISPALLFSYGIDVLASKDVREEIALTGQWCGELQFKRKSGDHFPGWASASSVLGSNGKLSHYFLVFSDITDRKEAERQIYRLAYYDSLTGLPNRAHFYSLLEQVLTEAHRHKAHGAVLFLDLNRFKNLNDSFGHILADLVLQEVGQRLRKALRKEDIVCRLGGDEFAIALPDITRREHGGHVAQKLLAALAEPFLIEQHEVLISGSIGISVFPEDGRDTTTLLKNADVAMYRAKKQGGSTHVFYSHEMNLRSFEQLKLESDLRRACERNEFSLHYQPQLDLTTGRINGAEALLRWKHAEHGMVSPAMFIPVAEETGLIIPIGEWVIDAACRQIKEWQALGLPPIPVAVNLSARQFTASLPQTILAIMARHEVASDLLELEITESMLMHSAESVVAMMREFSDAGIRMSLDDFGTGYSSLSYLKRFPIDNLKIDQSFVRGIPADPDDSAIARAIISMAKNLRLSVIAEGVETAEQLVFLREAGCDEIQGYHFSRPLPAPEFAALLLKTNG